jgi:hypothetical protein
METQLSGGKSGQGWDDIFIAVEDGVGRSREGGRRRSCKFNALILSQKGRRLDKALTEGVAKATSLSWLNEKKVWYSMTTSVGWEVALRRGKEGDDASWADTNLTGSKNKENSRGRFICTNGRWRFKATMSYFNFSYNIYKWDLVFFISSRRT